MSKEAVLEAADVSGTESIQSELAEKSRMGSREAFERLIRLTARGLFARLCLETGDPHHAEDILQETLLSAWKRIGQLDDSARFRGWLWTIARNCLVDAARHDSRKKRAGRRTDPDVLLGLPDGTRSPPERLEHEEQRRRAVEVLRSLPEEYRLPLTLRYLAGLDYQQIAAELGLSNGSLRGLLHRGLELLRRRMNGRETI